MKYLTIIALAVSATAGKNTGFLSKESYLDGTQAEELKRIKQFRSEATLNEQQSDYLDQVEAVIQEFDTENIVAVADGCAASFTEEQCNHILFGRMPVYAKPSLMSTQGYNPCTCSDESQYCPDAQYCRYGAYGCQIPQNPYGGPTGGCGFLAAYVCNGICIPSYHRRSEA